MEGSGSPRKTGELTYRDSFGELQFYEALLSDTAITQLGDLWILDDHRLLCGGKADHQEAAEPVRAVAEENPGQSRTREGKDGVSGQPRHSLRSGDGRAYVIILDSFSVS